MLLKCFLHGSVSDMVEYAGNYLLHLNLLLDNLTRAKSQVRFSYSACLGLSSIICGGCYLLIISD